MKRKRKFNCGDLVKLSTDNQVMTVVKYQYKDGNIHDNTIITVSWKKGGVIQIGKFEQVKLEKFFD